MSLNSPYQQGPTPTEIKVVPGRKMGPELDSYKHEASIPVGESFLGLAGGSEIQTPFKEGTIKGKEGEMPKSIPGRKNP